ncbi:hypothetical protein GCM10009000_008840 [Halobacterium noricense]
MNWKDRTYVVKFQPIFDEFKNEWKLYTCEETDDDTAWPSDSIGDPSNTDKPCE